MTPLVQLIPKHEADRSFLGNPLLFQLSAPSSFPSFYHSHSFTVLSRVRLFGDSMSVGFPKQEYCHGLALPAPGNLPDPGIEPVPSASSAQAGGFFTTGASWAFRSFIVFSEDPTTAGPCSLVWDPRLLHKQTATPVSPSPLCLAHRRWLRAH